MSGIFGVVNKKGDCAETLFYGTDYHSHLGTEYGGMAVLGKKFTRQIRNLTQTQFKSKFFEDYKRFKGNKGIGVISDFDEQPIYLDSKLGPFCIVTNGLLRNYKELAKKLLKEGASFSEVSKGAVNITELVAKLISKGNNFVDGIEKLFDIIDGSCSLLLLNKDGIYAARDRLGYTPLVVGKKDNSRLLQGGQAWAITTETSAFPNLGFEVTKYIHPGEIVLVTENGIQNKKSGNHANQICSFLWIYTGFPASSYEEVNVELARERCGRALAKADKDINPDIVAGIPDSGIAHAIGYAIQSGKPYRRPLVKYTPGYGRSYTPPSQQTRDLIAKMKLIPIKEIIEGKKIVICEDSIVRGTQLKNYTVKKLWDYGAKEIHVRIACPPLLFPCKFNLSTRRANELAARKAIRALEGKDLKDVSKYLDPLSKEYKKMVDWITKDLGVTSIKYQTMDDMVKAIGIPKEKLCLHCWRGNPHK